MVDPWTMAMTAIDGATKTAKKLRSLSKKIKDVEVNTLIVDLNGQLVDLKSEIVDLKTKNLQLEQELREAKQKDDQAANIEQRDDGLYYYIKPPPNRPDGPYCPSCFISEDKLVFVPESSYAPEVFGKLQCPVCKNRYGGEE